MTDFALKFPAMEILWHEHNTTDDFFLTILMGVKYVLRITK